jgi:mannosyltransferase OCH1-like enzyme
MAAAAPNEDAIQDKERLLKTVDHSRSPSPWRWPKRYLRSFRLRKATLCLLLIDVLIVGLLVRTLEPLITLLRRNEELFGPRVELSQQAPTEASHLRPDHHKIPRILHQTCANDTVPEKWILSQRSCKKAYVDFEYKLWTDESAHNFLAAEYPWFVDDWDNYAFPIQRADAIRYFVLHHYGGIYLDMDTWCNETFPLDQIESDKTPHNALFKSTLPTGVTNDFMIASARHPAYAAAISKLPFYYRITRFWARLQPYCNIMISSGPMFLTLVVKDYLLEQPSVPSATVQVVNATQLAPYITDLESSTWHQSDAHVLMWLGTRPWTWFTLGALGVLAGLYVIDVTLLTICEAIRRRLKAQRHKHDAELGCADLW